MAKLIKLYRNGNELNIDGSVFKVDGRLGHKSIRELIIFKNKTTRLLNIATKQPMYKNLADSYQVCTNDLKTNPIIQI